MTLIVTAADGAVAAVMLCKFSLLYLSLSGAAMMRYAFISFV